MCVLECVCVCLSVCVCVLLYSKHRAVEVVKTGQIDTKKFYNQTSKLHSRTLNAAGATLSMALTTYRTTRTDSAC